MRGKMGWTIKIGVLLSLLWMGLACSSTREPYQPPTRDYQMPVELAEMQDQRPAGSLWSPATAGNFLYSDQRAFQLGDLLTVQVEETASAQRDAATQLSRESEFDTSLGHFFGLMDRLQAFDGHLDKDALIEAMTKSTFSGSGRTGRSEKLQATVQVMVRQVLPNGNLFVEGHRVILVNDEEHHLYVSGVARPHDIDDSNIISSSLLAEADIRFTGSGSISDQQSPGVGQSVLNWIWPW